MKYYIYMYCSHQITIGSRKLKNNMFKSLLMYWGIGSLLCLIYLFFHDCPDRFLHKMTHIRNWDTALKKTRKGWTFGWSLQKNAVIILGTKLFFIYMYIYWFPGKNRCYCSVITVKWDTHCHDTWELQMLLKQNVKSRLYIFLVLFFLTFLLGVPDNSLAWSTHPKNKKI